MLKLLKRRKKVDPARRLREVLGDYELPSFPSVLVSALEKVRDPDSSPREIGDTVGADPGLSVRLLGTVNSPAFGLRNRVRSIDHAISLLGRDQLESLLISMAASRSLPSKPARGFEPSRFWSTAAKRATTARALADRIDPSTRSESFTASLLQDLAIPLLSHRKGDEYGALLEQWHHGGDDLASMERSEFGWDHAELGGAICERWHLPERQARAIAEHHDQSGDEPPALHAVRLVSVLRETGEEAGIEGLIEKARDEYGVPADETAELVRQSFEDAQAISKMFA